MIIWPEKIVNFSSNFDIYILLLQFKLIGDCSETNLSNKNRNMLFFILRQMKMI